MSEYYPGWHNSLPKNTPFDPKAWLAKNPQARAFSMPDVIVSEHKKVLRDMRQNPAAMENHWNKNRYAGFEKEIGTLTPEHRNQVIQHLKEKSRDHFTMEIDGKRMYRPGFGQDEYKAYRQHSDKLEQIVARQNSTSTNVKNTAMGLGMLGLAGITYGASLPLLTSGLIGASGAYGTSAMLGIGSDMTDDVKRASEMKFWSQALTGYGEGNAEYGAISEGLSKTNLFQKIFNYGGKALEFGGKFLPGVIGTGTQTAGKFLQKGSVSEIAEKGLGFGFAAYNANNYHSNVSDLNKALDKNTSSQKPQDVNKWNYEGVGKSLAFTAKSIYDLFPTMKSIFSKKPDTGEPPPTPTEEPVVPGEPQDILPFRPKTESSIPKKPVSDVGDPTILPFVPKPPKPVSEPAPKPKVEPKPPKPAPKPKEEPPKPGSRASGTNPRALGTNPRALGTNPRNQKKPPEAPKVDPEKATKQGELFKDGNGNTTYLPMAPWAMGAQLAFGQKPLPIPRFPTPPSSPVAPSAPVQKPYSPNTISPNPNGNKFGNRPEEDFSWESVQPGEPLGDLHLSEPLPEPPKLEPGKNLEMRPLRFPEIPAQPLPIPKPPGLPETFPDLPGFPAEPGKVPEPSPEGEKDVERVPIPKFNLNPKPNPNPEPLPVADTAEAIKRNPPKSNDNNEIMNKLMPFLNMLGAGGDAPSFPSVAHGIPAQSAPSFEKTHLDISYFTDLGL